MQAKTKTIEIGYRDVMYGYLVESFKGKANNGKQKLIILDAFPSFPVAKPKVSPLPKGANIFVNEKPPKIGSAKIRNYIELPWIDQGFVKIDGIEYQTESELTKNNRVIVHFVNGNPANGVILGRG